MQRIIAFNGNETLLDLRALDPLFQTVFGDAALRPGPLLDHRHAFASGKDRRHANCAYLMKDIGALHPSH